MSAPGGSTPSFSRKVRRENLGELDARMRGDSISVYSAGGGSFSLLPGPIPPVGLPSHGQGFSYAAALIRRPTPQRAGAEQRNDGASAMVAHSRPGYY
eukprot:CAMPEP_0182880596 /NCGR_PEP_ID=MMETSP0034_2-20130328/16661_1 /TAXON_ID=156128 /ORGANISM="Nephroselmis pyriformis, Strain CCMP717" /LENGTH=97 /DNA_ID=CAMNT_0025013591 /DNA_START=435 /DNA_END=726 /DNA_ORIENTATION=+